MAQTIKLRRSSTSGAVPTTSSLSLGEVAINTYDGKMYIKKNDGSDAIVELSGDKLPLSGGTLTGNLSLGDNVKARFGADNDLEIFHDGSNSYINDTGTGDLIIKGGNDILFQDAVGNTLANMNQSNSVELYWGNVKKFETTSSGIQITGNIANDSGDFTLDVAGDIILDTDGGLIEFKNGGTRFGRFTHANSNLELQSMENSGDILFRGKDSGGNNVTALTLDMSDAGVALFNSDIRLVDNAVIRLGDGQDFRLWHDGNHNTIQSTLVDSDIYIKGNDGGSTITMLGFDTSAGGNATFSGSVTSTGLTVGNSNIGSNTSHLANLTINNNGYIGSANATQALQIATSGAATFQSSVIAQTLTSANGSLYLDDNGSHNGIINAPASLFINIDSDNNSTGEDFVIAKDRTATSGGTELFRIDSSGNLLVGTTTLAVSSSTGSVTGSVINNTGLFEAAKVGTVMELNRLSSDGDILRFRKDGTTVGSIGVLSDRIYLAGANEAVGIDDSWNAFVPLNTGGGNSDADTDLGSPSSRWKDLWMSGIAYTNKVVAQTIYREGSDGSGLHFTTNAIYPTDQTSAISDGTETLGAPAYRFKDFYLSGTAYIAGTTGRGLVLSNATESYTNNVAVLNAQHSQGILQFKTASTERMRITKDGNVGIGTTSPSAQLHVKSAGNGEIEVERTSGALINLQAQSAAGYIGTDSNHLFGLKANGTVRLKIATGGAISFNDAFTFPTADGSADQLLKTDGSGNMSWVTVAGVGNANILSDADNDTKIQVEESADEDIIRFDAGGEEVAKMEYRNNEVFLDLRRRGVNAYANLSFSGLGLNTNTPAGYHPLVVQVGGAEKFRVNSSGSVGIGTTSPTQKLEVNGNIRADGSFNVGGTIVVTSTRGFNAADGTAAAPTHTFHSDQDTGMYRIGANHLGFATGGSSRWSIDSAGGITQNGGSNYDYSGGGNFSIRHLTASQNITFATKDSGGTLAEKMRIRGDGNVGIGTSAPLFKLHVDSGTTDTVGYFKSSDNKATILIVDDDTNTYVSAEGSTSSIGANPGRHANNLNVTSTGNVGIGTTSPSKKLTVAGGSATNDATAETVLVTGSQHVRSVIESTSTTGHRATLELRSDGGDKVSIATWGNNHMLFDLGGSEKMRLESAGRLLINATTTAFSDKLYVNNDAYVTGGWRTGTGATFVGELTNSSGKLALQTAANRDIQIGDTNTPDIVYVDTSAQNVGIGITSPTARLDVRRGDASGKIAEFHQNTGYGIDIGSSQAVAYISSGYNQRLDFKTDPTSGQTERMSILANGNVGIGGNSPTYKLVVSNGLAAGIEFGPEYATDANLIQHYDRTASQYMDVNHIAQNHRFSRGASEWMRITNTGNVGIGITSPNVKLAVDGQLSTGNRRLNLGILDLNSSTTPTQFKIITNIPFALGSADFTVNIKGFKYTGNDMVDLSIGWHYYNSTFYNASVKSSGSYAPTVTLGVENSKVVIHLTSPGYWPKLYVESMYSSAYRDSYASGWSWSDSAISSDSGTPTVSPDYASNFGNNFVMLDNGNVGIGTSSPTDPLVVQSSGSIGGGTTNANSYFTVTDGTYGLYHDPNEIFSDINGTFHIGANHSNGALRFQTGGTTARMDILANGNVGIGTTNPVQKLQVDGSIYSNGGEIYVNTNKGITAVGNLIFKANDGSSYFEGMRLASTGNVGIGITAPYYKLDTRFSNATTALSDGSNGNWGSNGIRIDNTNTTVGAMALAHFRVGDADWHIGNKRVGTDQADFIFANEGATKMLIDHTGNVGIGTTAPYNKLHVNGTGRINSLMVGDASASNTPAVALHIKSSATNARLRIEDSDSSNDYWDFYVNQGDGLHFQEDGANRVTFKTGGSVGIGTSSPDYKLDVTGPTGTYANGDLPIAVFQSSTDHRALVKVQNNNENDGASAPKAGFDLDVKDEASGNRIRSILTLAKRTDGNAYGNTDLTVPYDFNIFVNNKGTITTSSGAQASSSVTAGDLAMSINASGNVGIGDTTPTAKLTVENNDHGDYLYIGGSTQQNRGLLFTSSVGSSGSNYLGAKHTIHAQSGGGEITIKNDTHTWLDLTPNGNVGIGAQYSSYPLQVSEKGASSTNTVTNLLAVDHYPSTTPAANGFGVGIVLRGKNPSNGGSIYGSIEGQYHTTNSTYKGGALVFNTDGYIGGNIERMRIDSIGNVGIGTATPKAKLQVEVLGIETNQASVTSTSQFECETFPAADFRSARYTVQITNVTDSTYHVTEILLIHDGTTPAITEFATIFTGTAAEATFDADISSGNVRLLATPASTDSMQFKVVRHSILV